MKKYLRRNPLTYIDHGKYASLSQQDAIDFYLDLMSEMTMELNTAKFRLKPEPEMLKLGSKSDLDFKFEKFKTERAEYNNNPLQGLFFGYKLTLHQCQNCKKIDYIFDVFNNILLTVSSNVQKKGTILTLQDLFDDYFSVNTIEDYKCEKCGKKTNLLTQEFIYEIPKILFVYFNRSEMTNINGNFAIKKNKVPMKLKNPQLDLSPYVWTSRSKKKYKFLGNQIDCSYHLNGFIDHMGETIDSGHYVA